MDINVTCVKIDPYLNSDAGTMSPLEHGETYVLDDGGETDLDLGNYERFLDITLTKAHNITTGQIYASVISKERRGDYLGKTVQVVPHITDEIQHRLSTVSQIPVDEDHNIPEICLVEVGGTVGDIESAVFLEAIRQFIIRVGRDRCCLVHVSLIVTLGEQKTKPTQHSVKTLMGLGLTPDIIVCRSQLPLEESVRRKISIFCQVSPFSVVSIHDCSNIYHVPLILHRQEVEKAILKRIGLEKYLSREPDLKDWCSIAQTVDTAKQKVSIALVGKYTKLSDAYLSVLKALKHACIAHELSLEIFMVESTLLETVENSSKSDEDRFASKNWDILKQVDGIIIPGGFGKRGIEGIIKTCEFARVTKKPILGICLGMQNMVVEFTRNVVGRKDTVSSEVDTGLRSQERVIIEMLEHHTGMMGGTMRLGSRITNVKPNTIASLLYDSKTQILERHRHRYEVNPEYIEIIEQHGLIFSGKDDKGERMEIIELPRSEHPFYFGVQYHPELKSRPMKNKISPPFNGFILAASKKFDQYFNQSKII